MRISCPYCGERDLEEFSVLGEAAGPRPGDGGIEAFHDYVHLRQNAYEPGLEHWYHASGCRRWLAVRRDPRDHRILGVGFARP